LWFCGKAALYDEEIAGWQQIYGGPLDETIYSKAYKNKVHVWRFADLVAAGRVVVMPMQGITLSHRGVACYGCEGSPTSFCVYRPPSEIVPTRSIGELGKGAVRRTASDFLSAWSEDAAGRLPWLATADNLMNFEEQLPPRWRRNAYRIGHVEELGAGSFEASVLLVVGDAGSRDAAVRRSRSCSARGPASAENRCRSCSPTCGVEGSRRAHRACQSRCRRGARGWSSPAIYDGWTYDEPVGEHDLAMNEGRLRLGDGRTLAWREYGPPDGRPLLRFQGMPGSRYSRHPHEESYDRFSVRVIVADRPGFGASTRLGGRGISVVADDAVSLLDHLGLDDVYVSGTSGGGPYALAFTALCPERVRAASIAVGAAPVLEEDTAGLIGLNREAWHASREGWDAMYGLLAPVRRELLRDPLGAFRKVMDTAPPSDRAVMDDPDWQRVLKEDQREALRQGAEGWADEAMAVFGSWDFDPSAVSCSLAWWHGEHDANAPIAAVRRLVAAMGEVDLRLWNEAGHLEAYRRHDEILAELLTR
jgi:pimeloyl-ACP methyl ester carboxylesterase